MLRRLLLLPLLAALAAVIALVLLNPRPLVSLRLLVWTSPALPIGSWLAIALGGGGLLSASATLAALQAGGPARERREPPAMPAAAPQSPGPERQPGAAPPTVAVPYRVIRKGTAAARPDSRSAPGQEPVVQAVGDGWSDPRREDW